MLRSHAVFVEELIDFCYGQVVVAVEGKNIDSRVDFQAVSLEFCKLRVYLTVWLLCTISQVR